MARQNNKETTPLDWRRQAREVADSLAIAFILAMVIRHYVLEVFKIPTKSMEPTLLGDPWTGDKILVNKFAYDFHNPRRWDVVVFKFPEDTSRNYIKRLIALPGETLRIQFGDIFIDGVIQRKPWSVQNTLWRRRGSGRLDLLSEETLSPARADWLRNLGERYTAHMGPMTRPGHHEPEPKAITARRAEPWVPENPSSWELQSDTEFTLKAASAREAQYIHFLREINAYENRNSEDPDTPNIRSVQEFPTSDIMVQFLLVPESLPGTAEVVIRVETDTGTPQVIDTWKIQIPISEEPASATLWRGTALQDSGADTRPFRLPLNRPTLVQVCNVDRSIIVRVGGRQVLYHEYEPSSMAYSWPGFRTRARVQLGGRGAQVTFRHPALFADVYYTQNPQAHAVNEPYTLGTDEFFVCGDNSANSNDSRAWGTVPRRYLVGEAFLVLWPLARLRIVR